MKTHFLSILFLVIFSFSCTSIATKTEYIQQSEVIITRLDDYSGIMKISFDGEEKMYFNIGQMKKLIVKNGYHVVHAEIEMYDYSTRRGTMEFNCNNEYVEIKVKTSYNKIDISISKNNIPTENLKIITSTGSIRMTGIKGAYNTISPLIPNGSKIAIVDIKPNNSDSVYILEELMLLFVNSKKFTIVDRQTLESIRKEQRFQMSGEVSDETAVSIGKFFGANVVIVGNITTSGRQRRLRLRVLDVKTAQVIAMSSDII